MEFLGLVQLLSLLVALWNTALTQPECQLHSNVDSDTIILGQNDRTLHHSANWACALTTTTCNPFDSRWFFGNYTLNATNRIRLQNGDVFAPEHTKGTTIVIQNLTYQDEGHYTCEVRRRGHPNISWASLSINLILEAHLNPISSVVRTFNDSLYVELGCDMSGYIRPDEDLYWIVDGEKRVTASDNGSKYRVTYRDGNRKAQFGGNRTTSSRVSILSILDVDIDDSKSYSCALNNTDLRDDVQLIVSEASNPTGFPQNLQVTTISSTVIQVSWEEVLEEERMGNITLYEVLYSQSTFDDIPNVIRVVILDLSLSTQLVRLEEFVEYNISVRARTIVGPGPYSPASSAETFQDVPHGFPQELVVSTLSSTKIKVAWVNVPARQQNGIIVHYELEITQITQFGGDVTQPKTIIANGSTFEMVLEDLEEFVEYGVRVSAHTAEGGGPFSPMVMNITNEDRPAGAPENLTLATFTVTAFVVSWSRPGETLINGQLRSYVIEYCALSDESDSDIEASLTTSNDCVKLNISGNMTQTMISGLKENTTYSVSVAAFTIDIGPFASELQRTGIRTVIPPSPTTPQDGGPSIVGIVLGVIFAVMFIVLISGVSYGLVNYWCKKQRKRYYAAPSDMDSVTSSTVSTRELILLPTDDGITLARKLSGPSVCSSISVGEELHEPVKEEVVVDLMMGGENDKIDEGKETQSDSSEENFERQPESGGHLDEAPKLELAELVDGNEPPSYFTVADVHGDTGDNIATVETPNTDSDSFEIEDQKSLNPEMVKSESGTFHESSSPVISEHNSTHNDEQELLNEPN